MTRTQFAETAAIAFALAALALATPANAQMQSIGSGMATACYQEAQRAHSNLESIRVCNVAVDEAAMSPRNRTASYVNRGIVHLKQGHLPEAMTDFDTAIRLSPNVAEGHINRGNALIQMGEYSSAIEAISRGITLNPEEPARAYYSRARAYEESGAVRSAYNDYRRAAELAPQWDMPRTQLTRFRVG